MVVSSWANWELYSYSSSMSFVLIFYFSLWQGGLKVSRWTLFVIILYMVILCIVGASGFAEVCGISSMGGSRCPTYSPLLNVICFLVYFDKRIFIIFIDNVYVMILPLCWILIADEVCHMSFDCMAFDLDWNDVIVLGWYFESWLDNPYSCLLFTVYSVGEKSSVLLYVTVLFLIPGIWQGIFSGHHFQIVFLCLVVCHIWWICEQIWNLLF